VDELVESHRLLVGPRCEPGAVTHVRAIVQESHTERQTTLLVRTNGHLFDARWIVSEVGLEEIVLAYLARSPAAHAELEVAS
jgi:ABC-2 type transport system ATP-binding protein